MGDVEMAPVARPAPQPAPQPARQEPPPQPVPQPSPRVAQPEKPPAPMLKHYFDDHGFDRAMQRMRGGMRALTLEEILGFTVTDDTHGTFIINGPLATFNVDKQNDLKQISQLGSGTPARLAALAPSVLGSL